MPLRRSHSTHLLLRAGRYWRCLTTAPQKRSRIHLHRAGIEADVKVGLSHDLSTKPGTLNCTAYLTRA